MQEANKRHCTSQEDSIKKHQETPEQEKYYKKRKHEQLIFK